MDREAPQAIEFADGIVFLMRLLPVFRHAYPMAQVNRLGASEVWQAARSAGNFCSDWF